MQKKRILTGDRPTGPLHLGHYIGSLQNRVKLQETYEQYVMIADGQALTDHFMHPKEIAKHVVELAKDYLSIGINPAQTTILVQSQIPEIAELTLYYLNLVSVSKLERNPTVKYEIAQKGYRSNIPAGFLCYPVNQAADITLFQAEYVPGGSDQLPMIEQTNAIVKRFNKLYNTHILKECRIILSHMPRLVGIDGKAKASKSLGNAISLSDRPEVIKQKVFQMYTDPKHGKVSDPGCIEGNVVFAYLDAFHPDKETVEALKCHYKKGGLGDVTLKNMLNDHLQCLLAPIREKRETLSTHAIREMLYDGNQRARQLASVTMEMVRNAMGIYQ
ncbi:MAG: tryptophan--tRNA ligase [Candidatus Cardinium sp.]|nr:tryptophan--tRNA ligase [Candidatus Cardinium sp.]